MKNKYIIFSFILFITVLLIFSFGRKHKTDQATCLNCGNNFKPEYLGFILDVVTELKEKYKLTDKQVIFVGPFGNKQVKKHPHTITIFFTGEATKVDPEKYDFAIGFEHLNNSNYLRIPLYYQYFEDKINVNYSRGVCNPHKKYFACFLNSNGNIQESKLSEQLFDGVMLRDRIFHQLSLYKRVESGGKHLNNMGKVVSPAKQNKWLSECKFVIAYENQSFPGYITEKPFGAYFNGAIPIYYSDKTAVADLNRKAIIYARDYKTEEDLVNYVKQLDQDDALYCSKWNEKIITNPAMDYEVLKAELKNKLEKVFQSKFLNK